MPGRDSVTSLMNDGRKSYMSILRDKLKLELHYGFVARTLREMNGERNKLSLSEADADVRGWKVRLPWKAWLRQKIEDNVTVASSKVPNRLRFRAIFCN